MENLTIEEGERFEEYFISTEELAELFKLCRYLNKLLPYSLVYRRSTYFQNLDKTQQFDWSIFRTSNRVTGFYRGFRR